MEQSVFHLMKIFVPASARKIIICTNDVLVLTVCLDSPISHSLF